MVDRPRATNDDPVGAQRASIIIIILASKEKNFFFFSLLLLFSFLLNALAKRGHLKTDRRPPVSEDSPPVVCEPCFVVVFGSCRSRTHTGKLEICK